jgi:paraquat-inducible protein B
MSKRPNMTMIGAFVLGAMALFVVGVIFFESGRFFTNRQTFVLFFEGSLRGLDVGAPVMFRGVRIGSVTEINVNIDPKDLEVWLPVFIEIEQDRFREAGGDLALKNADIVGEERVMEALVERGLRAQLELQSILTGKFFVALDFHPDKPTRFVHRMTGYQELPTIPTSFQEITDEASRIIAELRELPVKELLVAATDLFQSINQLADSLTFNESLDSLNQTLLEVRQLVRHIDGRVDPVAAGLEETATAVRSAAKRTEQTLTAVQDAVGDQSPLQQEVLDTLEGLTDAARSLQLLADYLERHPEALLSGKGEPRGR